MSMLINYGELTDRIKKHFKFTPEELRAIVIGILIMAFIISFDRWGVKNFDFMLGLKNLFGAVLIVALAMLLRISAQRVQALSVGLKIEYRPWIYGLLAGLVVIIVTNGKLWLLAPGGILVYHLAGHRLGYFRYGLNTWPIGVCGMVGIWANLFLAAVFKLLIPHFPENILLHQAMTFNVWYAVYQSLPIPPLDGSHIFFASRLLFVFNIAAVAVFALSIYFLSIFVSLMIAIVIAALVWLVYYWVFETKYIQY